MKATARSRLCEPLMMLTIRFTGVWYCTSLAAQREHTVAKSRCVLMMRAALLKGAKRRMLAQCSSEFDSARKREVSGLSSFSRLKPDGTDLVWFCTSVATRICLCAVCRVVARSMYARCRLLKGPGEPRRASDAAGPRLRLLRASPLRCRAAGGRCRPQCRARSAPGAERQGAVARCKKESFCCS